MPRVKLFSHHKRELSETGVCLLLADLKQLNLAIAKIIHRIRSHLSWNGTRVRLCASRKRLIRQKHL